MGKSGNSEGVFMKYNKLVRDKIPEIIKNKGGIPVTRIADEEEYWQKLKEKLHEEVAEFDKDESVEELADILEVISAIAEHKQIELSKIEEIGQKKAEERGRFRGRIILEES
jgi:predicted house-cleaning noncanonical NTP pyrophosphatase (MazG superfamily)